MTATQEILARLDAAGDKGFDAYSDEYDRLEAEYGQDAIRTAVFSRRAQTTVTTAEQTTPETETIARFGTLLGAVVNVLPDTNTEFAHWECEGCTRKAGHRDYVDAALAAANDHATTCRALPRD